jgi:hypothetical protein
MPCPSWKRKVLYRQLKNARGGGGVYKPWMHTGTVTIQYAGQRQGLRTNIPRVTRRTLSHSSLPHEICAKCLMNLHLGRPPYCVFFTKQIGYFNKFQQNLLVCDFTKVHLAAKTHVTEQAKRKAFGETRISENVPSLLFILYSQ